VDGTFLRFSRDGERVGRPGGDAGTSQNTSVRGRHLGGRVGAEASCRDLRNCKVDAEDAVLQQVRHLEFESIWYSQRHSEPETWAGSLPPPAGGCLFGSDACIESLKGRTAAENQLSPGLRPRPALCSRRQGRVSGQIQWEPDMQLDQSARSQGVHVLAWIGDPAGRRAKCW